MTFKRALILGGAILLAAGCSSSVTAPIAKVDGGTANTRTAAPAKSAPRTMPMAATAADSATCRGTYTVSSGFVDTVCVIDQ